MFDRIESITDAAVWHGYDGRTSGAPNFERYNLLYGWNASGKTTLSRAFGLFEPSSPSKLPAGARVRLRIGGEVLDSGREQDQGRVRVRVFNRDFIDSNLQADCTQAPALFIVGQENIRLSNRIASLTRRRDRVATMYRVVQKAERDASSARERAATDLARECATMLGVRDFRSPNLKTLADSLAAPAESLLAEAALQEAVSQARDQSQFSRIDSLPVVVGSPPLGGDLARLLSQTPKRSTLKRLADNPALSDWVRAGLRFHEHNATCAFCGNDAAKALEEYSKHFSDEYRRQHAEITAALSSMEQPKTVPTYPHELQWVPEVRRKVQAAKEQLESWVAEENRVRARIAEKLRAKLADMEAVIVLEPTSDHKGDLAASLAKLHEAKDEHNRACEELSARRRAAATKVKEHFAARYLLDPGAAETMETLRNAASKLEHVKGVGQKIATQASQANEELQRSSVAASQINELLQRLLGPRICVEQTQDKRIQFLREGRVATNMSDGERTAISLAYFLVSLSQNGQRIEDLIVFVDDPICSLDANHIYEVAHLILSRLRACRQLFVSTHNSEFFNTIKQDWTNRGSFKKGHAGYLVCRDEGGPSQLRSLPKHLTRFRSDYHHVFYCLRQVLTNASEDVDEYLNCPNLLRRLLEMYLGFRRPTPEPYQAKLDILFDDEVERGAVARYVDEGSHSASTLRLLEFSDFPAMSKGMVERVLRAMERVDPDHYAVLMEQTA